jgi:hypothetical protein
MPATRRTRLSVLAAAVSGAIAVAMAGSALAARDMNCSGFDYREAAHAVRDSDPSDPYRLDGGTDGAAPATTPAAVPDSADVDRDCPGLAGKALAASDTDDGGSACDRRSGTEGRQVAVYPQGGVATGAAAQP